MAINMLFAIGLVHMHQLATLGPAGGWGIETQGLFLFGSVALALLAPARSKG
jgi:putative oxidoreductase